MDSLTALLLPPMLLAPLMGMLGRTRSYSPLTQELRRKTLHVAVGLVALSFPWLFTEPWLIGVALGSVLVWMLAVRCVAPLRQRFGGCLHDTRRKTHGEIYFAIAVAALLFAAGDQPVRYAVPVLILTFADAAAAIVGRAWPVRALGGPAAAKTVGGSAAFFVVAFVLTAAVLIVVEAQTPGVAFVLAAVIAAVSCIVEALSHRGSDNLSVPLVAYCALIAVGV